MSQALRNARFSTYASTTSVLAEAYLFLLNAECHVVLDDAAWRLLQDSRKAVGKDLKEALSC